MDKLEKVTKGLECHKNGLCQIDDKTSCPYWECEKDCSKNLIADALEQLKEQKNLIDGLIEDQLKKDEEQQKETDRLKALVKKKNRKIKKLMEDNYLNGGR